ncbi:hypothetical protein ACFWJ5_02450 [Streptomyces qaidamensis]
MTHLPSDLPRLRVLETWLQFTLDDVRRAIAAVETCGACRLDIELGYLDG